MPNIMLKKTHVLQKTARIAWSKNHKNLVKNKKAISSLFIAIYLGLIVLVLFSVIFFALSITASSVTDSMKIEQDRSLESIKLTKLDYNVGDSKVKSLLINNTGAIMIRIRAIYIDDNLVFDPKVAISPKESANIQFPSSPSILLDKILNANVTATTERGTKSTETVGRLTGISDDPNDPEKYYCGPLLILFKWFHWRAEPNGPWTNGWSVPDTNSKITWRIYVQNIDDRAVILNRNCCLLLISNDAVPREVQVWYIDSTRTKMSMDHGDEEFIYFGGDKAITGSNKININFLVIQGNFSDGTPFGQTIPFQAVKVGGDPDALTTTTMSTIASTQTVGQPVTFSMQTTLVDPSAPAIPSGGTIYIQYRSVDDDEWRYITPTILTNSGGTFTGKFTPPHAGIFEYRALFMGIITNQQVWASSYSESQTITVEKAPSIVSINPVTIELGKSAYATATISPPFATGTVTFEVSTNGIDYSALGAPVKLNAASAVSVAYVPTAPGSDYRFRAIYSGDADVLGSQSEPATLIVTKATPTLVTPTLMPANSIIIGDSVTATTTITGVVGINGIPPPTGTVTFRYSTDGGTTWNDLSTNNIVSGSATSDSYTPQAVGSQFRIMASYDGDINYNKANSNPVTLSVKGYVNDFTPTLNPASPVYFATPIRVTAVIPVPSSYPTPTGSVEFYISTNNGASFTKLGATITLSGGIATSDQYIPPSIGSNYQFKAIYLGDANYFAKDSLIVPLTVEKAPSTVTISPLLAITLGRSASATAIVTPSLATGTVTFELSTDGGTTYKVFSTNPVTSGSATSDPYTPLASGSNYMFRATYNGDSNVFNSQASAPVVLTVNKASPTLTTPTLNPASTITLGEQVTATVTITGITGIPGIAQPTGTVTFRYSTDSGSTWTDLYTSNIVSGSATSISYTPQAVGNQFRIRADYNGDANYMADSSSATLRVRGNVNDFAPTLNPVSPVSFGTRVTVAIALTVPSSYQAPTGNVEFYVSTDNWLTSTKVGATKALVGGAATSDQYLPPSAGSNYQFKAIYLGDANYFRKESTMVPLTVERAPSSVTINPLSAITLGQSASATAVINPPLATGDVTFEVSTDGGATWTLFCTSTISGGSAISQQYQPTLATSSAITHMFRATYNGDSNVLESKPTTAVLTVNRALPTLSTPTFDLTNPITIGQSVRATVVITGAAGATAPTGTVTFRYSTNGGSTWNDLSTNNIVSGSATSDPYTPQTIGGQLRIMAYYNGDNNYNTANSNPATLNVKAYPDISVPTLNPASPTYFGTQVTITVAVTSVYGTPTGNVDFYYSTDNWLTSTKVGATKTLSGGAATSDQFLPPSAGSYQFKASYIGDTNYFAKDSITATLTVDKAPSTTTISMPTSVQVNQPLTITANVAPPASTGTVSFWVSTDNGNTYALYTTSNLVANAATCQYTPTTAGTNYRFRANYNGDTNIQVSASNVAPITVYGLLDHFIIDDIGNQIAGSNFDITITAKDALGLTVANYAGSNTLSDLTGKITPTTSGTFVNGVKTVTVKITAATLSTRITTTGGGCTGISNAFAVNPAALHHFSFQNINTPQTAGTPFSITITAQDAYDNTLTDYVGQNSLTSAGNISPTTTGSFSSGVWTGNVMLTKTGSVTITTTSGATGTSNPITVNAASINRLVMSQIVSPKTVNTAFPVNITAQDSYGNTATGYSGTVTLTSSTGAGTISYTPASLSGGQWSGSVTITQAALAATISASSGGYTVASNQFSIYGPSIYGSNLFAVTITPNSFHSGTDQKYTLTITNLARAGGATATLGSAKITIPTGFAVSSATVVSSTGKTWSLTGTDSVQMSISASNNNNAIQPGEYVTVTFTPTTQVNMPAPPYVWSTIAYTNSSYRGTTLTIVGLQPQTTIQYPVTFKQGSLSGDAFGTVVTVAGVPKTYSDLPFTAWVEGTTGSLTYSYSSTVASSITGKQYTKLSSDVSPVTGLTVPTDVIGTFQTQYYLTIDPGHGTATGQDWYNAGSTAYARLPSETVEQGTGTRYAFTSWATDASGTNYAQSGAITMNGPKTATVTWHTEYQVTFAQSGLSDDATGTVATINGAPKTYAELPSSIWIDEATGSVSYSYQAYVASSTTGKRYILDGPSAILTKNGLSGPATITASYKPQYYLTVQTDPSSIGIPGISNWYTLGDIIPISAPPNVDITPGQSQYHFVGWTGTGIADPSVPSTAVTIDTNAKTITANYVIQYFVTFAQVGIDSDFAGTAINIGGVAYDRTGHSGWYNSGTGVDFSFISPLVVTSNGKQYALTSVSTSSPLSISAAQTIIGTYHVEYYLTVNNAGQGTAGGSGWYDANTNAQATIGPLIAPGSSGTQYKFAGWSGDASGSGSPSNNILMDGPKTATAAWTTQYYLIVNSAYSSATGAGWYDSGSTAYATLSSNTVPGSDGTQYVFAGWSNGASGSGLTSNAITMDNPKTATAQWTTQYKLTIATNFGTTNPAADSYWYDAGSTVSISATSPSTISGERYVWNGWIGSGDGSYTGTNNPADSVVKMNGPITETATWTHQYQLTVNSAYGTTSGSGWYDAGSMANFGLSDTTVAGSTGVQYIFTSWIGSGAGSYNGPNNAGSVVVNNPITETADWKTQYLLTVSSPYSVANGAGWYDSGSTANAALESGTILGSTGIQYAFTGWGGDASGAGLTSEGILMNGPKAAAASWKTQYYITVVSAYGSPTASGWVDAGNSFTAQVLSPQYVDLAQTDQWVCTGFAIDAGSPASGTSHTFTSVDAAHTIVFTWQEQYLITFAMTPSDAGITNPMTSAWCDGGKAVAISALANPGYIFTSWGASPTITIEDASLSSTTATINGPGTITVSFQVVTSVSVSCEPQTVDTSTNTITSIKGNLGANVVGETINLYYQMASDATTVPTGAWIPINSVTTASDGTYTYSWDISALPAGAFYCIKADFLGDITYYSSSASTGTTSNYNLYIQAV